MEKRASKRESTEIYITQEYTYIKIVHSSSKCPVKCKKGQMNIFSDV